MRSTVATIDLDALRWNLSVIRHRTNGAKVLGMVKANAYGHGMIVISRALEAEGIDMLGVALVDEAVELRDAGITTPIMILTPAEPHEAEAVVRHDLVTIACDVDQVRALGAAAVAAGRRATVHIYVDTGMHREGVRPEHAQAFIAAVDAIEGIDASGICTHFATSDDPQSPFLSEQRDRFEALVEGLRARGRTFSSVHMANTGAIWNDARTHATMVRPGLSLYGYASAHDDVMTLRPVLSLHTRVLSVRRVRAGETVSYGRRWMAPNDTTIATIPIGYGDGYTRRLSGVAQCIIHGRRRPVVGTICMDECMVDVGDDDVRIGDEVVLLGAQADGTGRMTSIDATDLAEWAHTIPYEITTAITTRVPRRYVDGTKERDAHV
jgi:alanine racemase